MRNKDRIPMAVATVLAETSGQRASSIKSMVTRAADARAWRKGKNGGWKGSFMTLPLPENTTNRLNRLATAFKTNKLAIVRAAIYTTLPKLEKAAKTQHNPKQCPYCKRG